MAKLYIGNLAFSVADSQLTGLFAELKIAVAEVRVMRDQENGRSRGFAFAELAPETDLAAAIKELNGKMLDGRALNVNEARPQVKRDFGSGGRNFGQKHGRFGERSSREERPKRKVPELY
jgi:RNA recognition motif-containing protein